jgi:predicted esterase
MPGARRLFRAAAMIAALFLLASLHAPAGAASEITLKDGTVIRGGVQTPATLRGEKEPSVGFILVDDGLRKVYFYKELIQTFNQGPPLTSFKPFKVSQRVNPNRNLVVGHIVNIVSVSPFDELGQRKFVAKDTNGEKTFLQGITEINPEFMKVQALHYEWDSRISTLTVPAATVDAIVRRTIDPKDVDDRLKLARFFLATEWFVLAGNELKAIEQEFPDFDKEQLHEAAKLLEAAKARRRLNELKLWRSAGMHTDVFTLLREFKLDGAPGEVLVEVRDLTREYESLTERMNQARSEIEKLSGQVKDAALRAKLVPALDEISSNLHHVEAFGRLDTFLSLVAKADLAAEEKLAAAISGWAAGNPFAEPNTDRAISLWEGRDKILQYVTDPNDARRQRLVAELKAQEAISVDLAAHVIENLVPWVPTNVADLNKPTKITVEGIGDRAINYWVQLPPVYSPYHQYPVILALHAPGRSPEEQIGWWSSAPGFQAGRHGYIVIAPEYVTDPKNGYEYDAAAHDAVLLSLIDARRRFSIDSDRVFLTGHSTGGEAAWDIGLAHPDLFAGVIPICGAPLKFSEFYWQNAQHMPIYIIDGERDGTNPDQITKVMQRMMRKYYNVIYVEFKGRGHENFSDDIHRLFDWMKEKARRKFPLEFACRTARATDNEFYFVSVDDFAPGMLMDPHNFEPKKMKPGQIEGKIVGTANSIQLTISGAKKADLWISPGMVDLTQPVTVRVNSLKQNPKLIPLDVEALLEDFRVRADRQKLFYAKMSFSRF